MDVVLVVVVLCAVLLAVRLVRARRRLGPGSRDTGLPAGDAPGRDGAPGG